MGNNKKISDRQYQRQQERNSDGQYRKYNRCECCGKRSGNKDEPYYSDDRCNVYGLGQFLCGKCGIKLADVSDEGYIRALGKNLTAERLAELLKRADAIEAQKNG